MTHETGVHKVTHDDGRTSRIVSMAADLKVVIGTLAALGALVVTGAAWFNGHVQAQAIKALGAQLSTDGSDVQNAFRALLDARAEEIEERLREEIVRNRDLESQHYEALKTTVWKATNPARQADSGEPPEDD